MAVVKFSVQRVERFIVTRSETESVGVKPTGHTVGKEYDSFEVAYEVAYALARAEKEHLGLMPGDNGVIFPASSLECAAQIDG